MLCTEDRFFPPELMRRVVADRLGIVPYEMPAGHAVALSRPKELANLLVAVDTRQLFGLFNAEGVLLSR